MRQLFSTVFLAALPIINVEAEPWSFGEAVTVTLPLQSKVFHHLDSSGRRNIAATDRGVAVAWEDDRDGTPRVYLAYKAYDEESFSKELRVSGPGEAYEPSLIAMSDRRFAIAWEEDGEIWSRLIRIEGETETGSRQKISRRHGVQATLVNDGEKGVVLWAEREGRFGRIRARRFSAQGLELIAESGCPVDATAPADEQLYPAASVIQGRLVAVWEDRRLKHTVIMAAFERTPGGCRFSDPVRISENPQRRKLPYGAGHGVSRVTLDRWGEDRLFAAWADKRNFRNGYDIWGAFHETGKEAFGTNQRVQDDFGGLSKQRHATVAGGASGRLVVAWDDEREGDSDLMLSWYQDGVWSDDWPIPVASGEGWQSSPTIAIDKRGNLHAAWIERDEIGGSSRLKYGFGRLEGD